MNPIISTPGAEYICPSCGKKSKLPMNIPKFGMFKVACFYCKYISEIKFDIQPIDSSQVPEQKLEPEEDKLNPLSDLESPVEEVQHQNQVENENKSEIEEVPAEDVEIPDFDLRGSQNNEEDLKNPVDHPMDLEESFPNQVSEDMESKAHEEPIKEEKLPEQSKPAVSNNPIAVNDSPGALVPYKKVEFSSKFIGKVADILDIEKISVPEDQYVPIFEVKKIKVKD